jgi:hypothetical protein
MEQRVRRFSRCAPSSEQMKLNQAIEELGALEALAVDDFRHACRTRSGGNASVPLTCVQSQKICRSAGDADDAELGHPQQAQCDFLSPEMGAFGSNIS